MKLPEAARQAFCGVLMSTWSFFSSSRARPPARTDPRGTAKPPPSLPKVHKTDNDNVWKQNGEFSRPQNSSTRHVMFCAPETRGNGIRLDEFKPPFEHQDSMCWNRKLTANLIPSVAWSICVIEVALVLPTERAFNQRNRQKKLCKSQNYCWMRFACKNSQTSGKYRSTTAIQALDMAFYNSESARLHTWLYVCHLRHHYWCHDKTSDDLNH